MEWLIRQWKKVSCPVFTIKVVSQRVKSKKSGHVHLLCIGSATFLRFHFASSLTKLLSSLEKPFFCHGTLRISHPPPEIVSRPIFTVISADEVSTPAHDQFRRNATLFVPPL